jgi:hypothetical protein
VAAAAASTLRRLMRCGERSFGVAVVMVSGPWSSRGEWFVIGGDQAGRDPRNARWAGQRIKSVLLIRWPHQLLCFACWARRGDERNYAPVIHQHAA